MKVLLCPRTRSAFSLMELLLVIFIVSLVYFLGFEGVDKSKKHPAVLTPLSLKQTIGNTLHPSVKGTFICTNECRTCYLKKRWNEPFKPWEGAIDLHGSTPYILTADEQLEKATYGRYHDSKICLKIDFYPNGSSTPLILQTPEGVYFLPAYFGKAQKTASLEKAQKLWLLHAHDLDDQGAFY